ncbi:acetyl-coenzyme A synthetase [Pichia membranifaciens]|uniref:Acetyl-coenzyme A synthetase 1 n=1 Tax=Pichia membranifaciens TaxID=4926 RepID=A0A1Q2YGL1_9ASCO|nr:acetyl-coenzyme A synthetase [Pichia membranifaciens]
MAQENLSWSKPFTVAKVPEAPHLRDNNGEPSAWFVDGELNACYNCVDRWAIKNPNKPAIIYEADEPNEGRIITFGELLKDVCRFAQVLKKLGVKKGDTVAVYLPMIPEAIVALMAIVRIGAVHSVVFAGFSSTSLKDRVLDADSKIVITTDESKRGGKIIETKKIVDDALTHCPDDGFYWILGRVDDVVNVSGHRLSTAEIEAALIEHPLVSENAVVGFPDELTGSAVAAFVSLKKEIDDVAATKKELVLTVRKEIGPFAAPKQIIIVDDLPKTRSGKIMRRILRKILAGEEDQLGDVSTLSNPNVVSHLIEVVHSMKK